MPIPPRIIDELTKRRYRKEINPIADIDIKSSIDYKLICPACNIEMAMFTNPVTGQKMGMMCPQCERKVVPGSYASDQKLEAKKKRIMNTQDNVITTQDLIGRRSTISTTEDDLREEIYMKQESASETFKKLKYAGKKKEEDSDEKMLRMRGLTIVSSSEKLPI
jgi:hypothetical protein